MLNISGGILQSLRNNGKLPYTGIGGLIYYDATEIDGILTTLKRVSRRGSPEVLRESPERHGFLLRIVATSFFYIFNCENP